MKITPKNFLNNLSIAKKSAMLIVIITLGTLLIGITAHFGVKKIMHSYDNFYQKSVKTAHLLTDCREYFTKQSSYKDGFDKWEQYLETYYKHKKNSDPNLQPLINDIQEYIQKLKNTQDQSIANKLNSHITDLIIYYFQQGELLHENSNKLFQNTKYLVIFFTALILIISFIFSILIAKSFKKILSNLADLVEEMEEETQELKDSIEQKIDNAIKEARQKDQIIYQNARLASMGEMIANIAHQWRQPLNALTLLIQSFGTKSMTGKLTKEFIDTQVDEGLRLAISMSDTIEDFRNFFSINREKEHFDLKDAINSTLDMSSFFLKDENIDINVEAEDGMKIYGYTNEFSQVLLNLINNTRENFKYKGITEEKKILIRLYKGKESIKLEFIDNGGGVKENIIDRIFEPYFTTKHKSIGTGIGLYMSKQIIETQMNGRLEVENIVHSFNQKEYNCAKFTIIFFE